MIRDVLPGSRIRIFSTPDPGSDPDNFPSRIPILIRRCQSQIINYFFKCSDFLTLLAASKKGRKQKGLYNHMIVTLMTQIFYCIASSPNLLLQSPSNHNLWPIESLKISGPVRRPIKSLSSFPCHSQVFTLPTLLI